MNEMRVSDIRNQFVDLLCECERLQEENTCSNLEIIGASFLADEDHIFGERNEQYIQKEIAWYDSQSTNVNDLMEKVPFAWRYTANKFGEINSNYGYLIFSKKFYEQYKNVILELISNPKSRRAQMIYTRPSIWIEYNENHKNDFICTNAVSYSIRDDRVNAVVQMRSNDCWAGYRNDYAWQYEVLSRVVRSLNSHSEFNGSLHIGKIYWQVMNLHIYPAQFYLVDHYRKTGLTSIRKSEYNRLYKSSSYCPLIKK